MKTASWNEPEYKEKTMREVVNSLVRLSTTMTVFGIQQVQTAIETMDTSQTLERARSVMDGMTKSLNSHMDEEKRSTAKSVAKAGEEMVDRTWKALDPHDLVDTTSEFVRKTSDAVTKAISDLGSRRSASEPMRAEEALGR
jgi:hypothetical protein